MTWGEGRDCVVVSMHPERKVLELVVCEQCDAIEEGGGADGGQFRGVREVVLEQRTRCDEVSRDVAKEFGEEWEGCRFGRGNSWTGWLAVPG